MNNKTIKKLKKNKVKPSPRDPNCSNTLITMGMIMQ
jgi:hypothetical protein